MYYYHAFKLLIQSELRFPELLAADAAILDETTVTIKFGTVNPLGLDAPIDQGLLYQTNEEALWLHVPQIARFLISQGRQIIIDPVPGIDEDSIRVFVLGSCIGALLMQRQVFLFHGNAIKWGEHCISFVGHSGIGKSTLSGAFFKRGYSILADDVCAVSSQGAVLPSFPQIKLWQDAAHHLGIETTSLRKIRPNLEKFAVPLQSQFYPSPLPLKAVYILNIHNKNDFKVETLTGMEKLQPLQNHVYRKAYLKGLVKEKNHFMRSAAIANQLTVVRVTRPQDGFKLEELVSLIEHDLRTRALYHERC